MTIYENTVTSRHIVNTRLVLNILDYSKLVEDDGFIYFLDFHKVFDSTDD